MNRFFIVAGDPSGDIHASILMKSILSISPDTEFLGIGGKEMTKAGLSSLAPIEEMSVVGFWEVAKKYGYFKNTFNKCANILQNEKIDAFIPVDYPGFNIRLSKKAKECKVPVIYYIAPQLWAWGKNRAKSIAENTDLLLTVFPFEKEYFEKFGIKTKFVGHPLLDNPIFENNFPSYYERKNLIALMLGSREQEIKNHLPIMEQIVSEIVIANPDYKIGIAPTNNVCRDMISNYLNQNKNWVFFDNSLELMSKAKAGIVKTGTSNLEAALCGMPFIMLYKTSPITYFLGKRLVNLDYISLVNILAKRKVVDEFIQKDINIELMRNKVLELINNKNKFEEVQSQFQVIKKELGEKGASKNAAETILDFIEIK